LTHGASDTQALVPLFYNDFSTPTATRKDEIVVDGKKLYVNLGYLAECSRFFAECYEVKASPIFIDDFSHNEVLELMRVCFACPQRKPINHYNINTVVTMASQYEMSKLLKRCERVIATQSELFATHHLFELTRTLATHQRHGFSMSVMVDRLARMDNNQFEALPFKSIPGDVVADIYSMRLHEVEKRAHHMQMWPKVKSLLTCAWLFSPPQDKRVKRKRGRKGGVRFLPFSPTPTDEGKRLGVSHTAVASERDEVEKVRKPVKMVTSTPIAPTRRKEEEEPTQDRFKQSPITGGEVADSDLEVDEGGKGISIDA